MSCSEIFGFVLNEALCHISFQPPKHNPAMFSHLSDALQAAADMVAPPCPRVEDLRYHWTQLSIVCQRCQHAEGQMPAVEETHVPRHLIQMLKALVSEEKEQGVVGPLSPCMEYLVQEKVLAMLASHAKADCPLGIRQHAYVFLVGVLNHLHHSHLHHAPIHKPLQMMVHISCEMRASPYETEEMEFLSTLCEKIQQDSSIVLLYIQPLEMTAGQTDSFSSKESLTSTPSHQTTTKAISPFTTNYSSLEAAQQKPQRKFPLIDALLNLCHSADSKISVAAHECLLNLASIREVWCSTTVAQHTLFPYYLGTSLDTSSGAIPETTEPALIEDLLLPNSTRCEVNENSDSEEETDDVGEFPGKKETLKFLVLLTYCDKVVSVSDGCLGSSICSAMREAFLDGSLKRGLTSHDEDIRSLHLALTAKIIISVTSPMLVNAIIGWLTEDSLERTEGNIRHLLLEQCQQPPHYLQIQSLRLLQIVLEKPGSLAVQTLVLNYLCSRNYHDSSAAEYQQSSWSDEEDERYKHRGERSPDSLPISRTLAPSNISKIVKRFLRIVPEQLRSTSKDDFESYMADAQKQYKDICRMCASLGWPREAVIPECPSDSSSTASRESRPEAENNTFYEGPFLSMLMNFLDHLPEQDYDINLQITSLVASLALLPHPNLHEYLLNPTLTLNSGVRTPYTVLGEVVARIHHPVIEREDYIDHLRVTRYQLLGTMEEFDFERDVDDRKFEALIVIEEFSKELASIAYAKYSIESGM